MTRRLLLRRKNHAAWRECLGDDNECRINSERSLQAAFWFHLSEELEISRKKPRRVFIEPHLRIDQQDFYPDIVICNSRQVIGVVELKYPPRKLPSIDKDIKTLTELHARRRKDLSLRSRQYLGPKLERANYHFSKAIVFAWAGVHRASIDSRNGQSKAAKHLGNFFVQLHIETSDNDAVIPDIDAE